MTAATPTWSMVDRRSRSDPGQRRALEEIGQNYWEAVHSPVDLGGA